MDKEWKFSHVLCDENSMEDDLGDVTVSTLEFDETGEFLASGDKAGRVTLYRKEKGGKKREREYRLYADYQSHDPEFDYLKSLEIEERINKIRWCKPQNGAHFLLSTNDKTIKLWKVQEKQLKQVTSYNFEGGRPSARAQVSELKVPRVQWGEHIVHSTPRRVFANGHTYHINSISLNSDGETYISADDLRINMWNLNISNQSFNIVDIKPANMEELTEVITAAEFHPISCNIFMYSSSKGNIKLGDMRDSALCDAHSKVFEEEEDPANKSFFSEIISSISDVKFSRDGRYILSRDYLTLKVWDINMDSRPVKTMRIHEQLRSKLCDLYESDCIFDKFECCFSHDGNHVLTGSYQNLFHVVDANSGEDTCIEASRVVNKKKLFRVGRKNKDIIKKNAGEIAMEDFTKKILHIAWHPSESTVAVAAHNSIFMYHAS